MTGPGTLCSDGTVGLDPSGLFHAACNRPGLLAYIAVALQTPSMNSSENTPSQA